MRKLSLLALLLLLVAGSAHAQSSSVSIQVTDSGGVAWANGTVTFSYVGPANPTWSGGNLPLSITATLNSSGAATQSVPDTNTITPGPASWALRICPQVGISAQCINRSPVAITGATPTLTLTPPAIQIQASTNFPISAYADAELVNVSLGFTFFNTVNGGTPGLRVCSAVSGTNCTSWSTVGPSSGGGGTPGGSIGDVQFNSGSGTFTNANGIAAGSTFGVDTGAGNLNIIFPADELVFTGLGAQIDSTNGNMSLQSEGGDVDITASVNSQISASNVSLVGSAAVGLSAPTITETVADASPVTPGSVTQRVVTAGPDPILGTDRNNRVAYNSTTAVAVSLPTAGSSGFAGGFNVRLSNQNTGTVTVTPATGTINGNATLVLLEGQYCFVSPSSAGTSYAADCGESQITAGLNIALTRSVHSLSVATVSNPVFASVSTGGSPPAITAGTGGVFASAEGTAPSVGLPAAGVDGCYADSTQHAYLCSYNNGSFFRNTQTICSGSQALGTTLIASGAAATTVTITCTGLASTDDIQADFNGSPLAVTGYVPSANGMLTIIKWPTSNTINISVVNNTASSITPGAITLNYRVTR